MTKEEAIKVLKRVMPHQWEDTKEAIETLIPELKESEDERIRKGIIALIEELQRSDKYFSGVALADMLAWLEKQKESVRKTPEWMPEFLNELRTKSYFDWDEHKDMEGKVLAIIRWLDPNYFQKKESPSVVEQLREISTPAEENWFEIEKEWENEDKDNDSVPVRFEEKDGEKYPIVDSKLMEEKSKEWTKYDRQMLEDVIENCEYVEKNSPGVKVFKLIEWLNDIPYRIISQPKET